MRVESDDVLALRAADPPGLRRSMKVSFAVHVGATLALLFVPTHWLSSHEVEPIRMTIDLGDGTGARLSGRTPAPGRTVEQVAEDPPRDIRPASSRPEAAIPENVIRTTPPKPPETKAPPVSIPRPPAPGRQVQRGRAVTETGNVGESGGLASGGERGGQRTDLGPDFCCPAWVTAMTTRIDGFWKVDSVPEARGVTIVSFVVSQNGAISDIQVVQSSGNPAADRYAQFAVMETQRTGGLPPLPALFTEPRLYVRLSFPYGVR